MDMKSEVKGKVEKFFKEYRLRKYDKGQILIFNGVNSNDIYFIVSGRVKEYDVSDNGDEIILNIFGSSAFFPASHMLNRSNNRYIFEAETAIEVRQAPVGDVLKFIKQNPDVLLDLLGRVYAGIDGIFSRMMHLMSGKAKDRLIYEIITEARRFGTRGTDGSYEIQLNEKDLGSRAGLSRETVSREVSKLKSTGLIETRHNSMLLKDLSVLEAALNSKPS